MRTKGLPSKKKTIKPYLYILNQSLVLDPSLNLSLILPFQQMEIIVFI